MNSLYIGIGTALILALLAALIGPRFVDWNAYRPVFEAQAARAVGLPVAVLGDIEVQLLPIPRLGVGDVVIGDLARPLIRVGRVAADLDVSAGLRGEIKVSEATFDRPVVDLGVDAEGRLPALPRFEGELAGAALETLQIVDGRIVLSDARADGRTVVDKVAGRASAERLDGVWRLDLTGRSGGDEVALRLAGRPLAEGTGVRGSLRLADGATTLGVDLVAKSGPSGPQLTGPVTLERRGRDEAASSLKATARLELDTATASLADLAIVTGDEVRGPRFEGEARIALGAAPTAEVRLSARRLDLDPSEGEVPSAGRRLQQVLAGVAGAGPTPVLPLRLTLSIDAIGLGGGTLADLRLQAATRPGGATVEAFSLRLPGDGRLDFSGRLALADGPALIGRADLVAQAPELLSAWWAGEKAGPIGAGALRLSGPVTITPDGFLGEDLRLDFAGARATGRIEKRTGKGTRLDLSAEKLDGEGLMRLARRFGLTGGAAGEDLALTIDARTVTLAGAAAHGTRLDLKLRGDDLTIERLEIADLAGARISGGGRIARLATTPDGHVDLKVAASAPEAAARALAGLISEDAGATAATIGRSIGPVDLVLALDGRAEGAASRLAIDLSGRIAGGTIALAATGSGRADDLRRVTLDGRTTITGARIDPLVAGRIGTLPADRLSGEATIAGRAVDGLGWRIAAAAGERRLTLAGTTTLPDGGPASSEVAIDLASPDLPALAEAIGRPDLVYERRLPIAATAALRVSGDVIEVGRAHAKLGETVLDGQGRVEPASAGRRRLVGSARLDDVDLELADASLRGRQGGGLARLVDFDLTLSVDRLRLGTAGDLEGVRGRLLGDVETLRAEGVEARLGKVTLNGEGRVRRVGESDSLAGRIRFDGVTIGGATPPTLQGRASGEAILEASRRQGRAFAGTIGGSGRVVLDEARLIGIDVAALRPRPGDAETSGAATAKRLLARMAGKTLAVGRVDLPFLVEAGVAASVRAPIEVEGGRLDGRLSLDFGAGTVAGSFALEPRGEATRAFASAASGALPSVDLTIAGPATAPHIDLGVGDYDAFLTLYRLEKEIEAAETIRQDQIERARFTRLLRRLEDAKRAREAPPAIAPVVPAPPPLAPPPVVAPAPAVSPAPPIVPAAPSAPSVAPHIVAPMSILPDAAVAPRP